MNISRDTGGIATASPSTRGDAAETLASNYRSMQIEEEIESLGYQVIYVPYEVIGHHLACYNVEYEGKIIRPRAVRRLKIPLNEIWISETLKNQTERVLFHELQEIRYRRKGYSAQKAHEKAAKDEQLHYGPREE